MALHLSSNVQEHFSKVVYKRRQPFLTLLQANYLKDSEQARIAAVEDRNAIELCSVATETDLETEISKRL